MIIKILGDLLIQIIALTAFIFGTNPPEEYNLANIAHICHILRQIIHISAIYVYSQVTF